ncbi:MAG: EF-hand domain-containing protein [Planctomycetota bacterium]
MSGGGFELSGGFWPGVQAGSPICRGDCDCDGWVNFDDINPFVAVLGGANPCRFENCDINGDGAINFDDINPFVALLTAGGGPCP